MGEVCDAQPQQAPTFFVAFFVVFLQPLDVFSNGFQIGFCFPWKRQQSQIKYKTSLCHFFKATAMFKTINTELVEQ